MNRLERLRSAVDGILQTQPDPQQARCGFVHLYGVSQLTALLALRRGLDPEICATAGMLHDISSYRTGDPTDHARRSSLEAAEILADLGCYRDDEIKQVGHMIACHSDKDQAHDLPAETLKDADVLQHYLYRAMRGPAPAASPRLARLLAELQIE